MNLARLAKHLVATQWSTRRLFPPAALDAIEQAIAKVESAHAGEIRFAIETAMPLPSIWRDVPTREHGLGVFGHLGVWNTENNNGVLIFLQVADRKVEIIADRGFQELVSAAEWEAVCRLMEAHFRAGNFRDGSIAGVEAVGTLIARHFPATTAPANELPNRPALF